MDNNIQYKGCILYACRNEIGIHFASLGNVTQFCMVNKLFGDSDL